METMGLAFISIFDLFEFKKQARVSQADVKVNLLIGEFTQRQIELALNYYKARIVDSKKTVELLS